jgi:hypothetical protein
MNRQELIYALTRYEIEWLIQNTEQKYIEDVTDFFSTGGFTTSEDKELQRLYDLKIGVEVC